MNKLRIVLGYLLGFITSVILALLCLLLIVKFTIGDKNYVLKILEKNNYYQKIDDEIKEEMSLYILSSGFSDEIINDVYEYNNLVNDINNYIDSAYDGKVLVVETSDLAKNIEKNINEFFKKNNYTYNSSDLKSFIDGLVNVYSDEVLLYHFTDNVLGYIPKIINVVNNGITIAGISLIILLVVLLVIKYQYFIATIISSGLIILFIRLAIFERIDVNEILIITEKFSEVLRIVLHNLQDLLLIVAISLIGFGLIILILALIVKLIRQLIKRNTENVEIL